MSDRRRVESIMQKDVAVLGPKEHLDLADDIMRLGRIRHLPVVDGEVLVGVVSSRDLMRAALTNVLDFDPKQRREFLHGVEVGEVMAKNPVTVTPDATQRHAAELMLNRQIGCLPVVGPGCTLVGLVTETDLLRAFVATEDERVKAFEIDAKVEVRGMNRETLKKRLHEELDELRRARDEMRVQANLGKAEAREAWERNEDRFKDVEQKLESVGHVAEESLHEVGEAVKLVLEEIRDGFKRVKSAL